MIALTAKQKKMVCDILDSLAPECEVRAYGSRVNGSPHVGSDLDLVIMNQQKTGRNIATRMKTAFEESNLPFRVDILSWDELPDSFKKNIERNFVVMQPGSPNSAPNNDTNTTL